MRSSVLEQVMKSRSFDVDDIVNVICSQTVVVGKVEFEQITMKKCQKHYTVNLGDL